MVNAKAHQSSKGPAEGSPAKAKVKSSSAPQAALNPIWRRLATRVPAKPGDESSHEDNERESLPTPHPVQTKCAACEEKENEAEAQPVQFWNCRKEDYFEPTCVQTQVAPFEPPVQSKCAACEAEEQVQQEGPTARSPQMIQREAQRGLRGASTPLPHGEQIQAAFGHHDVSQVRTSVGGDAATANRRMGALAFASGDRIGFREAPSLHLAAHEAAHVVQQHEGLSLPDNVGRAGDRWERHADRVADAVTDGRSAEPLLDEVARPGASPAKDDDSGQEETAPPVQRQITSAASRLVEPPPFAPPPVSSAPAPASKAADKGAEPPQTEAPKDRGEDSAVTAAAADEEPEPLPEATAMSSSTAPATPCGPSSQTGASSGGPASEPAPPAPTAGGGGIGRCYNLGPPPRPENASEPTSDEQGEKPEGEAQITCPPWPDEADECLAEPTVAEVGQRMPEGVGPTNGLQTAAPVAGVQGAATAPSASFATARVATAEVGASMVESGALDAPIASAEGERDAAISDYLASIDGLAGVMARARGLEPGITLPSAEGRQQAEARQAAIEQTRAFMARAVDGITAGAAFAQEQVPARLGALAEATKASIQEAMETAKSEISDRIAQARKQAQAGAEAARAQVQAEYANSAALIEASTLAAIALLDAKHAASVERVDEKETSGLDGVNARFAAGRAQHEAKGPEYAARAIARGQEHAHAYESCKVHPDTKVNYDDDGFWDGCLNVRRARAQQDAACRTAASYKDAFLQMANQKGYDLREIRKQYRCAVISGARQVVQTLDATHQATVSGLESGRMQALGGIALARDENLAAIDAALSAALDALTAQEFSQRQAVNDTGYLKQLAVEQLAHSSTANLARGVSAAMDSLERTLSDLRERLGQGVPEPESFAQSLALTEAALGVGMGAFLETMEGGAQQGEARIEEFGATSLEAMLLLTAQNDEQSSRAEGDFAQQMGAVTSGASSVFSQLTGNHVQQTQQASTEGAASMERAVAGFDASLATIGGRIDEAVAASLKQLTSQLDEKLAKLDDQIASEAWKAADKEQPAWKSVLAIILVILVIIAAVLISIATLGAGAGLFATILVGALVGAVSAGLIQIINNWSTGAAWHEGLVQAMVIGAVGGALGGGLGFAGGALAAGAATAGARVATQFAITMGADLLAEGLTQTFAYVAYGQKFNWQGFVMAGAMSGVSFRAHPGGARGGGRSGAAHVDVPAAAAAGVAGGRRALVTQIGGGAALGLGLEYATSKISGEKFDLTRAASSAASSAISARMARRQPHAPTAEPPTSRLGRAAERFRTFDPGNVGKRLEQRLQGLGGRLAGAPPGAETPAAGRQRSGVGEEGELREPRKPTETAPEPGVVRLEADIEIGGVQHTMKLVETAEGPILTICTDCQRILAYIDQAIGATTNPQFQTRLAELRARVAQTEFNLKSNKAADDVNTMRNMLRLMTEVDFLVPRNLEPAAIRPPRERFDDLATNPEVASRAAELFDDIYAGLWGSRRAMFRGGEQGARLKAELTREAMARALHQARAEVEGGMTPRPIDPLALPPAAPARATINPRTDFPMGFRDRPGFDRFSHDLNSSAGPNIDLVLQGSSLPGRRFERTIAPVGHTGEPFDVGRISDYDVAIVSSDLHARAQDLGIKLGPDPLTVEQLTRLGLKGLHDAAQAAALRETGIAHPVHFKLFRSGAQLPPGPSLPLGG